MRNQPTTREEARRRLIVALDMPSTEAARALVARLGTSVRFYKVGLELWARGGREACAAIHDAGAKLFLDLKLHDIPETVRRAVEATGDVAPRFVTVHGPPSSVRAAAGARLLSGVPELLGVTVLTSMSEAEARAEYNWPPERGMTDLVVERGRALHAAGCGGLVASAQEAAALRAALRDATLVTPGIRPAGADAGDQARVATPGGAVSAGADYLVVGRPIRDAADPATAAEAIVDEMWSAWRAR
jgi:orotidine-5'-phosphate decarboxylase